MVQLFRTTSVDAVDGLVFDSSSHHLAVDLSTNLGNYVEVAHFGSAKITQSGSYGYLSTLAMDLQRYTYTLSYVWSTTGAGATRLFDPITNGTQSVPNLVGRQESSGANGNFEFTNPTSAAQYVSLNSTLAGLSSLPQNEFIWAWQPASQLRHERWRGATGAPVLLGEPLWLWFVAALCGHRRSDRLFLEEFESMRIGVALLLVVLVLVIVPMGARASTVEPVGNPNAGGTGCQPGGLFGHVAPEGNALVGGPDPDPATQEECVLGDARPCLATRSRSGCSPPTRSTGAPSRSGSRNSAGEASRPCSQGRTELHSPNRSRLRSTCLVQRLRPRNPGTFQEFGLQVPPVFVSPQDAENLTVEILGLELHYRIATPGTALPVAETLGGLIGWLASDVSGRGHQFHRRLRAGVSGSLADCDTSPLENGLASSWECSPSSRSRRSRSTSPRSSTGSAMSESRASGCSSWCRASSGASRSGLLSVGEDFRRDSSERPSPSPGRESQSLE